MSGRLVSPTFIGRREALCAAADQLRQTEKGRASHLLVAGEAGIGKTRFSEAVADSARVAGFLVLRGGCLRLGSGELPYEPIAMALRALARDRDPDTLAAVVGDGARLLNRIARLVPSSGASALEPKPSEATQARLLRALLGLFGRLAELTPVLLVVEDLHWADSASRDALSFLLQALREERVALLLTFRSDELHRRHPLRAWLGEVERLDAVARLELGPFEPTETGELISAIRGGVPAQASVDAIQARSDGNPFFVEELLGYEDGGAGPAGVTISLRDILLGRVASVSDDAQSILRAAAVAGRRVDSALLARTSGVPPEAFDAAVEATIDRCLLVLEHGQAGDHLAFRHALIQDGLLPGERIRLHRTLAQALAERPAASRSDAPGRWAELAHHWDAARDEPRALEAAVHAAAEAAHAYAFTAALAQYRRALAGWELVTRPETIAGFDRVELLSRAAEAAWLAGDDQVALLREAIAEADRRADAIRGALLRGRLGYALWVTGDPAEARGAYEDAVAMLPPGPATSERAWILARLGQALMLEGNDGESRATPSTRSPVSWATWDTGRRRSRISSSLSRSPSTSENPTRSAEPISTRRRSSRPAAWIIERSSSCRRGWIGPLRWG